jgi:hypothetical protein
MFNLCYDVPVKIYSSNIVLMAAILVLPDARRLFELLVLGRGVALRQVALEDTVFGNRPRLARAGGWVTMLFLAAALYDYSADSLPLVPGLWHKESEPAPFGDWKVVRLVRGEQEVPLDDPDPLSPRWITLLHMGPWPVAELTTQDGQTTRTQIQQDPVGQRLLLPDGAGNGTVFHYVVVGETHMRLEASSRGRPLTMELERMELSQFKLISRGFHWVNEVPFNH